MNPLCLAYLVSQHPAIHHPYLLEEIQILRKAGIDLHVASISAPDRPVGQLSVVERDEAVQTFYVKSAGLGCILRSHAITFLNHPGRYLGGLFKALSLARGNPRKILSHFFYFAEAVVFGRWMVSQKLSHVHIHYSTTIGLLATRIFPITMSMSIHGSAEFLDPAGFHLAEKIASSLFVRAISQYGRSQLMKACHYREWEKIEVARLGVQPLAFPVRPFRESPSPFEIVSIGRLSPEKGQHVLVTALELLVRQGRDVRLRLLGDGPDRQELEQHLNALEIRDRVIFEGAFPHDRLAELCREADVCALTSFLEGIPLVLMEAMAMEIPCVAPRITGIPELIRDGIDGILFAPSDQAELVEAISRLMGDPALRRRIGQAARQRVLEDYDLSRNGCAFAATLQHWLNPTSGGSSRRT
jgi:glycosyltransferase involved in cell wall biosynthesis